MAHTSEAPGRDLGQDVDEDVGEAARIAEIEARYAAIHEREDQRLRLKVARYAALPVFAALLATIPLLASLFGPAAGKLLGESWALLVLLLLDFPILLYAGTIWWRQRFRTPDGTLYQGPRVRLAAGLVIAGSLGVLWVLLWVSGV